MRKLQEYNIQIVKRDNKDVITNFDDALEYLQRKAKRKDRKIDDYYRARSKSPKTWPAENSH